MQRLFTMFPSGWPGVALLLLRASVGIALLFEPHAHQTPFWFRSCATGVSVAILAGYLTPVAAVAALVVHCFGWAVLGLGSFFMVMIFSLDAIALAFLGPGTWSIDSYRFGRRVVVLPPD